MISDDTRRWLHSHPEIPKRSGKLLEIDGFDAALFGKTSRFLAYSHLNALLLGIPYKQVTTMDPMCRLILENTYEAIIDAGLHPKDLEGTNTGVFIGACISETEKIMVYDKLTPKGSAITG